VALSFVQRAKDIAETRKLVRGRAAIMANRWPSPARCAKPIGHTEVDSSVMCARNIPAHVGVCGTDQRISRTILPNTSPCSLSSCATAMSRNGKRRPTDDRGSRQDQKRRHLNLQRRICGKPPTNMKWS